MTPSRLLICNNATQLSYELARICNPCQQFHASWRGFVIRAISIFKGTDYKSAPSTESIAGADL
jgi:hypothetical protein